MNQSNHNKLVLVTGGTGSVGIHCILQLLQQGYRVRATIRSLSKKDEVINMLKNGGITSFENLSFIPTDLSNDDNWNKATENCTYVLHVASPISLTLPKTEEETIRPAVEGTLRVLRAAKASGVEKMVITSSFAAVGYSHNNEHQLITEADWTNPEDKHLSAYLKSKVLAEKAAWDYIKTEGEGLSLAVINPMAILGPMLSEKLSSGHDLLKRMFDGSMKAIPQITLGIVDVRDVADLHIRAMEADQANGERFLALAGGTLTLPEIALMIKAKTGLKNIVTRVAPNWLIRLIALYNPAAKNIVPQLGRRKNASNEKARSLLNWKPRSNEEAVLSAIESMIKFEAIKK